MANLILGVYFHCKPYIGTGCKLINNIGVDRFHWANLKGVHCTKLNYIDAPMQYPKTARGHCTLSGYS